MEHNKKMNKVVEADFADMEGKLRCYLDKGRVASGAEIREEPITNAKPDVSLIKPLQKTFGSYGSFMAVDCSTRTLKRANNWGIYLMRPSYVVVKDRVVNWGFNERICTVVGDSYTRSNFLTDFRIELESEMALQLLHTAEEDPCSDGSDPRSNYLLLDGGGYFGGLRKFRVSLYEQCEKIGLTLLAISKNSPSLHDDKGRDFVASASALCKLDLWVYHPVRKADKNKSLYGDISLVRLCKDSNHVFRCDIMEYLTDIDVSELLSPLTSVSEDPRCIGYPICLYLAHDFSAPSDSMLLSYHDLIEEKLRGADLLESIRREERCSSFGDELHGTKHAFQRERWNEQY
jgi:hypothetical protein